LYVARNQIWNEINNSEFIVINVDETIDIFNKFQLSLIFRYKVNEKPVERFWLNSNSQGYDYERKFITSEKLILQTYDGGAFSLG